MTPNPQAYPTYPDLDGQVAFITGGSRGIGLVTASMLARNGVRVAVVARGRGDVDAAVKSVRDTGGEAIGIVTDCTSFPAIEEARARTERELGPVSILMPFAGGLTARTPLAEIDEQAWHHVVDSNLTATFLTLKSFVPGMIDRRRGVIVTMASNAARTLDLPLVASYAAAKAGILALTRHAALELAAHGIRANAVAPATLETDRVRRVLGTEGVARVAAMAPLGRIGQPEDAALVAVFLASAASAWLTGITIDVAGGRVMM